MSDRLDCVVAIPAMNEAERIKACLNATLNQRELDGRSPLAARWAVIVFANNCTDATSAVASAFGERVKVVDADLPDGNAGAARRRAMDIASAMLGPKGIICTTDADSRPRSDWLAHLMAGIDRGAQAVAGAVDFEPSDRPPGGFGHAREQEAAYSALQAEIMARVDPEPHNPWPNHLWAWGANLAVTACAYRRVGGMPEQALAEDRAFVERLKVFDVPVKHCLGARVWTSARREGRAPGGLASLVNDHLGADREACDAALESARAALRRAKTKARLRLVYAGDAPSAPLARALGLTGAQMAPVICEPTFGAAWRALEEASPALARRRLYPFELAREIEAARRILSRLAPVGPNDRSDRIRAASAGLWSALGPPP